MINRSSPTSDSLKRNFGLLGSVSCQSLDLNDQKVIKKYVQANSESCALLKAGLLKQALEILENSQRNFKQMAENGQNVNEILLTATMHNISAAHQRLGNTNKSLDYIRTLLYKLNNRILKVQKQNSFESNLFSFNMDINIAKCYIYFLSLTIQLKMLEASVVPANRALEFFKKFCKDYHKSGLSLQLINTKMTEKLFFQIEEFQSLRTNTTQWQLMENLKESIQKIKNLPVNSSLELSKLKGFRIENLTTINELEIFIRDGVILQKYPGNKGFENGFIEFPLCLFLIGKSLQLASAVKNKKQELSQRVAMVDKTKQYILWSLYFLFELCPYYTPLHKEFLDYYEVNFQYQDSQYLKESKKVVHSFDSLQTPSLKDSETWRYIKRKKFELESEKVGKLKISQTRQEQNPILNQKKFLQSIELQKRKVKSKQKLVEKKRFNRHSSQEVINTEKIVFQEKLKTKNPRTKKQFTPILKAIAYKIAAKPKEQAQTKQKKKLDKKNLSLKNISLSKGSIKDENKTKKIKTEKKFDDFLEEYFPKSPETKKKDKFVERGTFRGHQKKQLADKLNLQKRMRQSTKSLSLPKKNMFKIPKRR